MIIRVILGILALSSAGCFSAELHQAEEYERADPKLFSQYFRVDSGLDRTDGSLEVFLYPVFGKALKGKRCSVTSTISVYEANSAKEGQYQLVSMSLVDIASDRLADQSIYFVSYSDEVKISVVYSSISCETEASSKIAPTSRLVFTMPRKLLMNE